MMRCNLFPLFDAAHSNLLTPAQISMASIGAMSAAVANQRSNGERTGARLRYLFVPLALEARARFYAGVYVSMTTLSYLKDTAKETLESAKAAAKKL